MKQFHKMLIVFLLSFLLVMAFASFSIADSSSINCAFTFSEEYAQIGEAYTFSYALSGGSGSYRDINIEAEFVTVHDYTGNDVDDQYFEKGSLASGTVTFTPIAGTAVILWLRGYDAKTDEYFYFECHEGWLQVQQNPQISITIHLGQDEASIGQELSARYEISGTSSVADAIAWWQVGGEMMSSSTHLAETSITSVNGHVSVVPSYGEYIYLVLMGKDENGSPFYAESEHLALNNPGIEKIACNCSFPEQNPQIGVPYYFSYDLSGGSGSFSEINVEAEFVTVHDYMGHDVDDQIIELGSASSGTVTFIPKAGTAIILWLRGKDAVTQQSFYFECHEGWLPVEESPIYPVAFSFDQDGYQKGDTIEVNYDISNLIQLNDGKLWWVLVSDYEFKGELNAIDISSIHGESKITPTYGEAVYAVIQGADDEGKPIYAESKHIALNASAESLNTFVLPSSLQRIGEEAFLGTAVQRVVMPSGIAISNIAFNAFQDTPIKVIVGNSEDARTYALEHGVLYESIE